MLCTCELIKLNITYTHTHTHTHTHKPSTGSQPSGLSSRNHHWDTPPESQPTWPSRRTSMRSEHSSLYSCCLWTNPPTSFSSPWAVWLVLPLPWRPALPEIALKAPRTASSLPRSAWGTPRRQRRRGAEAAWRRGRRRLVSGRSLRGDRGSHRRDVVQHHRAV